jgi:hypothetical protein
MEGDQAKRAKRAKPRRKFVDPRKRRKAKRLTKSDREIRQVRKPGRERARTRGRVETGIWVKLGQRRKKYEEKLPYERWEAYPIWKAGFEDEAGSRRKRNQVGRTGWRQAQVNQASRALRYYEAKPRGYEAGREGESGPKGRGRNPGSGSEALDPRETPGSTEGSRWGFWKTYEPSEGKQVLEWKKTLVYKKALSSREASRGGDKALAWDRAGYLEGSGSVRGRRTLIQSQGSLGDPTKASVQVQGERPQVERRRRTPTRPGERLKGDPRRQRPREGLGSGEARSGEAEGGEGNSERGPGQAYAVWEEVRGGDQGRFSVKKTRRNKRKVKLSSLEGEEEKRQGLKADYHQREGRRFRDQGGREVTEATREKRRKEKVRLGKKRKTRRTKRKTGKKKARIWSPYGKRRRRYGSEGGKGTSVGRCQSG